MTTQRPFTIPLHKPSTVCRREGTVPDVDPPSAAIVADRNSPAPGATAQSYGSQTLRTLSLEDVKALVKAGLSDEVILSQIRNSQAVYHLTTAEIIDLKHGGVSENVIDYMIIRPMRCRSTRSYGKSIRPRPMRRMTPSHWSLTLHDNTSASERLNSCRGPGMMVHNLQHSLLMERRPLTQLPWLLFSVSMWGLGIALSALIIEKLYFQ